MTEEPVPAPLPIDETLRWNECYSLGGLFTEATATLPTGDEVPPGWEQPADGINSYQLKVFQCARVSIGPFERPVIGMTEVHNKISPPPQCIDFKPDITAIYALVRLWLNDVEVADYLHSKYGMPVGVASFAYEVDTTAPIEVRRWTWTMEGSEPSELGIPFVEGDPPRTRDVARMVWHNGSAVSMVDTTDVQVAQNQQEAMGVYTIQNPPMHHAQVDDEPLVGRGSISDGEKTMEVFRFGDLECKKPL